MPSQANPAFLDQAIGRLVYAIIPLNIFLTIGYGATTRETHNKGSLMLYLPALVALVVFWAIATVRLVARRRRKNRWRLIALTPPTIILVLQSYAVNESIPWVAAAFLLWLLASLSIAFMPLAGPTTAVDNR